MAEQRFRTSTLRSILPAGTILECVEIGDYCFDLDPAESRHIAYAVQKRKNEFSSGRYCAKQALRKLLLHRFTIPVGPMREPIWPNGVSGSISHDDGYALAVVAAARDIPMLGVDITSGQRLDETLIGMICSEAEIHRIGKLTLQDEGCDPYKLIFSLKESIYKCLFPLVKRVFDFRDVSVHLFPNIDRAEILLENRAVFAGLERRLEARYCYTGDYIFSAVWFPSVKCNPECRGGPETLPGNRHDLSPAEAAGTSTAPFGINFLQ
jgi:enterobactin synthetase component D